MVRVRIAPSPTGFLHIGNARAALYNFLFAKKHGGTFVLRVEDTDKQRSTSAFEKDILEGLRWLGLQWDEGPDVGGEFGPYRQSERLESHQIALRLLLEQGSAYFCYCTPQELEVDRQKAEQEKVSYRYNGRCQKKPHDKSLKAVVRFRLPEDSTNIVWEDLIRGTVSVHTNTLDDFIIARSIDSPLYNFAVVVDDAKMKITHVIRGEDHISNTPKQILITTALGHPLPVFGHIPLILNADRSKMSKRKNNVSINHYREVGYLPEAMVNFLALLGWNPGAEQELFSLDELCRVFDIDRTQKSGAIFNEEKLRWFNQQYLAKRTANEFEKMVEPFIPKLYPEINIAKTIAIVRPRITVLSEAQAQFAPFTQELPGSYAPELLLWPKALKQSSEEELKKRTITILEGVQRLLSTQIQWEEHALEQVMKTWITAQGYGVGDTLWPLRVALSGQKDSPNPFELLEACGTELSRRRIVYAIKQLQ